MKNSSAAVIVILLLSMAACSGPARSSAPNNNSGSASPAQSTPKSEPVGIPAPAPEKFNDLFVGKIDKYDISVALTREGDKLAGFYSYENNRPVLRGVLNNLSLEGTVDQAGKFTLKETEYKASIEGGESEKQTGQWQGVLSAELINDDLRIKLTGNWSKPDGSKSAPFTVTQEKFDLGRGVKIVTKELNEKDAKLNLEFKASYPHITGLADAPLEKFNTQVENNIKKGQRDFKKDLAELSDSDGAADSELGSYDEISYQVTLATREIISVQFHESSYSAGAAHPNSGVSVFNYSPRSGSEIKLANLFLPNAPYRTRLDAIIKKLIESNRNYDIFPESEGETPYARWNAARNGLLITLDVSHALGDTVEAFIPYGELKDIIDPNGPLASVK